MSGVLQETEAAFWNAVRVLAHALRSNPEAWLAEQWERRLWESLDERKDNGHQGSETPDAADRLG